jgi:hypothetical protein
VIKNEFKNMSTTRMRWSLKEDMLTREWGSRRERVRCDLLPHLYQKQRTKTDRVSERSKTLLSERKNRDPPLSANLGRSEYAAEVEAMAVGFRSCSDTGRRIGGWEKTYEVNSNSESLLDVLGVTDHVHNGDLGRVELLDDILGRDSDSADEERGLLLNDDIDELGKGAFWSATEAFSIINGSFTGHGRLM